MARVWDEQLLELIRQVVPAPTVHARNLFHLSAAMWDAWAAYDPTADGYFVNEKRHAGDVEAAREAAISYAAYRILLWRYGTVSDLPTAAERARRDDGLAVLPTDVTTTDGDSPAALGNRIAAAVLAFGLDGRRPRGGALRRTRRTRLSTNRSRSPSRARSWPTRTAGSRCRSTKQSRRTACPSRAGADVHRPALGPCHARSRCPPPTTGTPIDPGPPPRLGDPATDQAIQGAGGRGHPRSSQLDPADGVTIDISPASFGNNTLGTNDGDGHAVNPVTGQPYAAECGARGPTSPGPWPSSGLTGPSRRRRPATGTSSPTRSPTPPASSSGSAATGRAVDRLEWDVKLYLALNGAVHDAAIAAWGVKGFYDSARPISMIRYMGGKGQSSDPDRPSYDPEGLPLVPGLVEVDHPESSAPGQRHAALADHVGEIAIRSWRGFPEDPKTQTSGVGWIRAVDWVPVPAVDLRDPGIRRLRLGPQHVQPRGSGGHDRVHRQPLLPRRPCRVDDATGDLLHEEGPTPDVTLQWATYYDAADQAGISRLYMGIHIPSDDIEGRKIGSICGKDAIALAINYFDGSARP